MTASFFEVWRCGIRKQARSGSRIHIRAPGVRAKTLTSATHLAGLFTHRKFRSRSFCRRSLLQPTLHVGRPENTDGVFGKPMLPTSALNKNPRSPPYDGCRPLPETMIFRVPLSSDIPRRFRGRERILFSGYHLGSLFTGFIIPHGSNMGPS